MSLDERTFGLASEQKLISLDDGAALILTVANYYNPGQIDHGRRRRPTEIVRGRSRKKIRIRPMKTSAGHQTQKRNRGSDRARFLRKTHLSRAARLLKAPRKRLLSFPWPGNMPRFQQAASLSK